MGLALDRADRNAENIGGVTLAAVLEIAQDDDGTLPGRQLGQNHHEVDPILAAVERVWRRDRHARVRARGLPSAPTPCGDRVVVEDSSHIGVGMLGAHLVNETIDSSQAGATTISDDETVIPDE